ncbi:MAG: efflux RND transporter periplasmic adaptor subunit [Prevotellaceae bacterium]|nr:efflux RND transporter periplasmic adaptor subunit [Prevotellaceae bacterium]
MKKIAYLALGATLLTACSKGRTIPEASNEFAVEAVTVADAELETSYPATIKSAQDVEVRPKLAGNIVKVCVDEGAAVTAGQVLFQIDPTQYQAAVRQAEAAVEVSKTAIATQELTVSNKRMLREKNVISDYDLQMAENTLETYKAQLQQAQAALAQAKDNLHFCSVTAPSSGVIGTIPYKVGALVSSSIATPLTTVSNLSTMNVYFSMTEKQMLEMLRQAEDNRTSVTAEMPAVRLQLSDGTIYGENGTVDAVSGIIDRSTGSVTMRATFANPQKLLRSGGTGAILVPTKCKDAILVKQSATYEVQDKKFVYVLAEGNKVKSTEITVLSQNDGKNYVVTSGLKAGDRIVVQGVNQLKDGQEIKPITPAQADANREKARQDLKEGNMPGQK